MSPLFIFNRITISWLYPLNGFRFIFLLRDSENDLFIQFISNHAYLVVLSVFLSSSDTSTHYKTNKLKKLWHPLKGTEQEDSLKVLYILLPRTLFFCIFASANQEGGKATVTYYRSLGVHLWEQSTCVPNNSFTSLNFDTYIFQIFISDKKEISTSCF